MNDSSPRAAQIAVILNVTAGLGHGEDSRERLVAAFAEHGLAIDLRTVDSGGDIEAQVRAALDAGARTVVAGGGDGTLSAVASILRGTSTALGILPLGTLNHFARDLRIPQDLGEAIRVIAQDHRASVDVGEVNGRSFINNASLGIYPDIVRDRERQQRRLGRGKWWAMFWATWSVLRRSPFLRLTLEIDGEVRHCRSPFVFVGNSDYTMEGFSIGVRSSVCDSFLSVYTTQRRTRGQLLGLALRALVGRLRQADDFSMERAKSLRIDSRRRWTLVATDGEVTALQTPLEFRVVPGALTVIVPKP